MSSDIVSAKLFDAAGVEKGVVPLASTVFGGHIKAELLHGVVRWQRAKARAGTHSVLTRSNIKGGAKKPWKQKGTGRARAGSSVSPIWVGGAVVHGPTPRGYEFRYSKRMRQGALISALTLKASDSGVIVLEGMDGVAGKTKQAVGLLESLGLAGQKVLVVIPNEASDKRDSFARGFSNIQKVTVLPAAGVNVYDLLNAGKIVCVRAALGEIEARLGDDSN